MFLVLGDALFCRMYRIGTTEARFHNPKQDSENRTNRLRFRASEGATTSRSGVKSAHVAGLRARLV